MESMIDSVGNAVRMLGDILRAMPTPVYRFIMLIFSGTTLWGSFRMIRYLVGGDYD